MTASGAPSTTEPFRPIRRTASRWFAVSVATRPVTFLARGSELGAELRVGRPDLPRTFDDVALVDQVPESFIAGLPGVTAEIAERIVSARRWRGGFLIADDLVVFAGVRVEVLELCRDRLLLPPR